MFFLEIAMLNGYSGIWTRNFGLCLPSLLVGQTMTRQSWTGFLDFSTGRMSRSSARFNMYFNHSYYFFAGIIIGSMLVKINCVSKKLKLAGHMKSDNPILCEFEPLMLRELDLGALNQIKLFANINLWNPKSVSKVLLPKRLLTSKLEKPWCLKPTLKVKKITLMEIKHNFLQ